MKRLNQGVFWALFLLLAGAFLLLRNLGILGPIGELVWGAVYAVAGLAFLVGFIVDTQSWWRAIPAFTLLSLGVPLLLTAWQKFSFGGWQASVMLFGVALGFWAVLLVRAENWWAEIPAGILTLLGIMTGLRDRLLDPTQWLIVFTIGLGLVFALLYILRARTRSGWWPAIPAAALILFGAVLAAGQPAPGQIAGRWWPAALMVVGLVVLVLSLQRLPTTQPQAAPPGKKPRPASETDFNAVPAAQGTSVTQVIPEAELPQAPASAPEPPGRGSEAGEQVDIYDWLKKQPPETPSTGS